MRGGAGGVRACRGVGVCAGLCGGMGCQGLGRMREPARARGLEGGCFCAGGARARARRQTSQATAAIHSRKPGPEVRRPDGEPMVRSAARKHACSSSVQPSTRGGACACEPSSLSESSGQRPPPLGVLLRQSVISATKEPPTPGEADDGGGAGRRGALAGPAISAMKELVEAAGDAETRRGSDWEERRGAMLRGETRSAMKEVE